MIYEISFPFHITVAIFTDLGTDDIARALAGACGLKTQGDGVVNPRAYLMLRQVESTKLYVSYLESSLIK